MVATQRYTVEEFDQFVDRPENADRLFEYIGGEIIEVPSNPYASYISGRIFRRIANFVEEHDLGFTTGEAGGYVVSGEKYAPDVAYLSKTRQSKLATEGYNPVPPNLAVEVDFPSTYKSQQTLLIKVGNYLAAETVVWIVRPETKTVDVYVPGERVKILDMQGTLDGGDILPGFKLSISDIFPDE
ncbi:MAG TPA: Uma2 family endonuclease [Aggregatilineaceae bacterium]|nr:Uma2 family endonuclease [Aggregatilineaceae bacterium]